MNTCFGPWGCLIMRRRCLTSYILPINANHLKALILDIDGTLYRQTLLRGLMFQRMLRTHIGQPARGLLTLRVLRAYRRAQEVLRASSLDHSDLAEEQLRLASEWTGVRLEIVRSWVARWMEHEPLDFLAHVVCEGVVEFLQVATACGLRLGVFSDYPGTAKLIAMEVVHFFDVVVSAQDPEVQKFKPSPRGLEVTLRRLGVKKHQALYIGDRPDIDAAAASRAEIACVIIGRRNTLHQDGWTGISGYKALKEAICR
jgi:putative hydrolase of the HAD superfamily